MRSSGMGWGMATGVVVSAFRYGDNKIRGWIVEGLLEERPSSLLQKRRIPLCAITLLRNPTRSFHRTLHKRTRRRRRRRIIQQIYEIRS